MTSDPLAETIEWLSSDFCHDCETPVLVAQLGERLRSAGLPIDRLVLHLRTLHPQVLGRTIAWSPGEAVDIYDRPHGFEAIANLAHSPVRQVLESKQPLLVKTADRSLGPPTQVDVYRDRKLVEILFVPLKTSSGPMSIASFCCADARGFSEQARAGIERIVPALRNACELRTLRASEQTLLDTYTGATTAQRILSGQIRRGHVESLRAALMLCDLRGFTELSNQLPVEHVVEVLDAYFDLVVPAIERSGGEIIKFMGDAALAFFERDDPGEACRAALAAAEEVLASLAANTRAKARLAAGVALHYGTASYGNIGSGRRLDFTVIGSDVNLTSRIQSVCSEAGHPLLLSREFAGLLGDGVAEPVGRFALKGFGERVELFVPRPGAAVG